VTTVPDEILTLIGAAIPGVTVFDGRVGDTPADRWVVVYPDPGTVKALAVCGRSDSATFRWQVTSVAPTRQRAAWLAGKVRDATVDVRPVVAGWVCGPVCHNYAQLPQHDETVAQHPVVYQVDLYDLLATRI
jgi:hypothetical protein